ncbi:hypothetical protein ACES2L_07170 [Bdellovibrio bacteriovorus]
MAMNLLALTYFAFNRHKITLFLKVTILFSCIGLVQGLFFNHHDRIFFSHIYGATVPILGFYFGYTVFKKAEIQVDALIDKLFFYVFYFLFGFMVIYFTLVKVGVITYFGLSSTLPLFLAYFFARKKYLHVFLAFVAILLSGKRVVLVQSMVVFLPMIFLFMRGLFREKNNRKRDVMKLFITLVLVTFAVIFIERLGVLKRMTDMFSQGWDTAENLYNITAGRSAEFIYAVISLNESPMKWLIGGGFGNYFWEPIGSGEMSSFWRMHYSHFSPMHLVLIYGLPFAVFVFLFNLKIFIKALSLRSNFYANVFLMYFLGSFFGALMFVDLKYWFFAGAAKFFIDTRLTAND